MSKNSNRRRASLGTLLCFALAACDGSFIRGKAAKSEQQLLTEIERTCLDDAERGRRDFARQYSCNAQCDAELVLQDSETCSCQRKRLERDYYEDELQKIATWADVETHINALSAEGLGDESMVMKDLRQQRSSVLDRLEASEVQKITGAYSISHGICADEITAKAITRR